TCSFLEQGGSYDVMIVDYMMPELTAGELLERTRGYLSRDGFIILISGHTDVVEQLNLKSMGVDIFLPKPLDLELLWEAVGSGGKAESRSMPT
ncbi:MAG TPA: response regulator, partial [Syntrophobacteraceae bacterium]|nr:response regulator [Syntrophobacteraceae bacterium]